MYWKGDKGLFNKVLDVSKLAFCKGEIRNYSKFSDESFRKDLNGLPHPHFTKALVNLYNYLPAAEGSNTATQTLQIRCKMYGYTTKYKDSSKERPPSYQNRRI